MADTPKGSYSLNLKGDGLSISRDVDQATARAIVDLVLGDAATPTVRQKIVQDGGARIGLGASPGSARLSLREFLDVAEAKRNPDKIVTIGEYIITHERQVDFTREDVKARFRNAGEAAPANYARDFNWTISNGWIAEDPNNRDRYYVTQKGKAALGQKFSLDIKRKSGIRLSNRRRVRRKGE